MIGLCIFTTILYHDPRDVYDHLNLDWEDIYTYYRQFYENFYLNRRFVTRRLKKDLFSKRLFYDFLALIKTDW